jgi:hypothetical protein
MTEARMMIEAMSLTQVRTLFIACDGTVTPGLNRA